MTTDLAAMVIRLSDLLEGVRRSRDGYRATLAVTMLKLERERMRTAALESKIEALRAAARLADRG